MERLANKLPRGFGYEWTGQSLQEKLSGSQAPFLLGLSVLVVFLLLAALYESWTIPLAVLLTIPLGITGAVHRRDPARPAERRLLHRRADYDHRAGGERRHPHHRIRKRSARARQAADRATVEACSLRFRPILMTGLAFVCGVLPMAIATGAGGASQQALGTTVMGGMIAVVILALLMVPVFFVSVQRVLAGDREKVQQANEPHGPPAPARPAH